MIIVTCIVKATRSQNPAPNHCAASAGAAPDAMLAAKTMAHTARASANASGNQRSNQSERRSPAAASEEWAGSSGMCCMGGAYAILLIDTVNFGHIGLAASTVAVNLSLAVPLLAFSDGVRLADVAAVTGASAPWLSTAAIGTRIRPWPDSG